jgi:hypothetical protein
MNKKHKTWPVSKLADLAHKISYPEYQREPFVWDLIAKQRLIDSILRGFDIASIYFYVQDNIANDEDINDEDITEFECIDGRQRINAILSFLGRNKDETLKDDLSFKIRISNEVDPDQSDESLSRLNDNRYTDLDNSDFSSYKKKIDDYKISIVLVSAISEEYNELNLLFQRLNLGKPLNAGEKLHAMAGDMRDYIFGKENGITLHDFFKKLNIYERRYSREQVAAQIVYNYFSRYSDAAKAQKPPGERYVYSRTRYYDLQLFFKEKMHFSRSDEQLAAEIQDTLSTIYREFGDRLSKIKNRAIAVSLFLYAAWLIKQNRTGDLTGFSEFLIKLIKRVDWQVKKLSKIRQGDPEYQELFTFQSYITQAAGEEYAIAGREKALHDLFQYYLENNSEIKGDSSFKAHNPDIDPDDSFIPELS